MTVLACVVLPGVHLGEACTIVLRGATQQILDEAERSLHDALCVLSQTIKETRTVFGGGQSPSSSSSRSGSGSSSVSIYQLFFFTLRFIFTTAVWASYAKNVEIAFSGFALSFSKIVHGATTHAWLYPCSEVRTGYWSEEMAGTCWENISTSHKLVCRLLTAGYFCRDENGIFLANFILFYNSSSV